LEGHNSRFGFQREKREGPGLLSQEREKKGGKKKRLGQLFFLFRVAGVRVTPPLQEVTLCFCPINTALSLSPLPPHHLPKSMTTRNPALKARNARRTKTRATSRRAPDATRSAQAAHSSLAGTIAENAPASAPAPAPAPAPASSPAPAALDAQHPTAIGGGMSPEAGRGRAQLPPRVGLAGQIETSPSAPPSRPLAPPLSAPAGLPPCAPASIPPPAAAATERTATIYNW